MFYDRDGAPTSSVIVAKTPRDERVLAYISHEDAALIAFLTDGVQEPVGATGHIRTDSDGLNHWRFS